ncbi:thermonuclease family protein [Bacillus benzoevorans]|uniref:Micrococcal nuclease n=1 Tax=Bacillus benzoevorans TaxID=1456 RepID=A0A7X0HYG1_9BACI|nr:thermonuclease family protein [Bacillus benzoevorans]MBB6447906.1 micrococcal nuclease [Bacillus benzoevorans]
MIRLLLYLIICVLTINIAGCTNITSDEGVITQKEHINQENNTDYRRIEVELAQPNDGDTIAVVYKGNRESVRFLLVDSPETSHPRLGEQPYGKEAKEFTKNLVENAHKIELEFDIGPQKDKYGRLLAYVYVDGKLVQDELLRNGLARVAYIYPPNTRYVDQFNAIQKEAQQKGIGIWEIESYAQEDGFHPELMDSKETEDIQANDGCLIKGNIGSEKIYHTPNSPWYEQTKAEVMFCTEGEAIEAGFRPPKQ